MQLVWVGICYGDRQCGRCIDARSGVSKRRRSRCRRPRSVRRPRRRRAGSRRSRSTCHSRNRQCSPMRWRWSSTTYGSTQPMRQAIGAPVEFGIRQRPVVEDHRHRIGLHCRLFLEWHVDRLRLEPAHRRRRHLRTLRGRQHRERRRLTLRSVHQCIDHTADRGQQIPTHTSCTDPFHTLHDQRKLFAQIIHRYGDRVVSSLLGLQ